MQHSKNLIRGLFYHTSIVGCFLNDYLAIVIHLADGWNELLVGLILQVAQFDVAYVMFTNLLVARKISEVGNLWLEIHINLLLLEETLQLVIFIQLLMSAVVGTNHGSIWVDGFGLDGSLEIHIIRRLTLGLSLPSDYFLVLLVEFVVPLF